jgi:CubicO group peptidase (beta-lactamase class C family)
MISRRRRGTCSLVALLLSSTLAFAQAGGVQEDVKSLTGALSDPDPRVRERSTRQLVNLGAAAAPAIGELIRLCADPDPYVQGGAASALGAIGKSSVPALIVALKDTCTSVRWCAAIALGKMAGEATDAAPALTDALADKNEQVRWCAAAALSGLGRDARQAVPALRNCLSDRDADVRWAAGLALEAIDPEGWVRNREWQSAIAMLDSLTPHLMEELHVPGVAIALIRDGEVRWSKNFGIADVRGRTPVTDETLFEAASMSKPVFACAVMKLAEENRLDLDRPLSEYRREPDLPQQAMRALITPRMILSHTSGLPNWRKGEEERDGPLPIQFSPGSKFGYSGEGMFALQRVVEQITGEPLDVFARRTLLDPLGMKASGFAWNEAIDEHLATGHDENGLFLQKTKYVHANSAYTLYTTAREYATFLARVLQPGVFLSQTSLEEMLSYQVHVDIRDPIERPGGARGRDVWWGLGWSINTTDGGDIIHHSGANRSGFRCFSQYSPRRRTGLVIMTNGLGGGELWTRLVSAVGDL